MVHLFERGYKQGHERKVNKMLKVVFTRSSYSSCLHNMVEVFSPCPPTPKIKKMKTCKKIPYTWLVISLWFSHWRATNSIHQPAYHQVENRRGLNWLQKPWLEHRRFLDSSIWPQFTNSCQKSSTFNGHPFILHAMQKTRTAGDNHNTVMKKKVYRQSKSVQPHPLKASTEGLNLFFTRSLSYSQETQSEEKVISLTFGQTKLIKYTCS